MTAGVWILLAAVALTAVIALAWRRLDGRFRPAPAASPDTAAAPDSVLGSADLDGAPLGERATLVHFSSAFCAPCRATRQVLTQVSGALEGVRQVEIDAESHLDLVRRLDVRKTPTVLVLDPEGRILTRAAGRLRPADVHTAIQIFTS